MTQGHLRTSLQKFRRDQLTASCFGGRPQASRRRRGSYEQVCKGCCGGGGRDRGDAGVQTWSPRPPCYALYRSSPRSMRPGTPLNAATMRLVLRYVGILWALTLARSFHDNTLHVPLSQPSNVDSNSTCPVPPTTKVDRGTSSFSLRLVQVGK